MPTHAEVRQMVRDEAVKQGLNPDFVERIARQESGFNQDARSPAGAIGTMQLMPATARGLGVDPYDLEANIRGGVTYLKQMAARFPGAPELQVAAYNAGPGAVAKYGGVPPYPETRNYVKAVLGSEPTATLSTQPQAPGTARATSWTQALFPETQDPAQDAQEPQRRAALEAWDLQLMGLGDDSSAPAPEEEAQAAAGGSWRELLGFGEA